MTDRPIPKISGSGVTIGGSKTLEEYLDEKKAKEDQTELLSECFPLYTKPNTKIIDMKKGRKSYVRQYSRREINIKYWKEQLMEVNKGTLSQAAKIDLAILTILLSGKEHVGTELKKLVMEALPEITKKSFDIRCSHLIRKTDISKVVIIKRQGNNNVLKLVTAALDLTPQELHTFAYKNYSKQAEVLAKHKALKPYFETEKSTGPQLETKIGLSNEADKEPEAMPTDKGKKWSDEINGTLETALSKALGVDVNVSGRIEIVFKFG